MGIDGLENLMGPTVSVMYDASEEAQANIARMRAGGALVTVWGAPPGYKLPDPQGGLMHEDVPQDEMTAEERAAAGVDPPNAAPAPDTSPPEEKTDDGNGEDGDGDDDEAAPDERTDDPKPVDDPNLPEEGDPDQFESEPINPGDMDPTSGEGSEAREEPADLSGVEKEFDED